MPQPEPAAPEARKDAAAASPQFEQAKADSKAPGMVDPMQWWGALTNQFQQLAANTMKDGGAHHAAFEATREMASGALKTATDMAAQMAAQGMQGAKPQAKAAASEAASGAQNQTKARPAARKTAGAAKKASTPRAPR